MLRENNLWEVVVKLSRIHCLGHVIFGEGIIINPKKVEAIVEFLALMKVQKVRSFLGLARYYRWFIEGFSKIVNLIT